MSKTVRIASAANTIVPAYLTIKEKGYHVSRNDSQKDSHEETWYAEKDNVQLTAEDPVTLLGLVEIFECRGHDWKASDEDIDAFINMYPINSSNT